ncbi:hypothetical protein HSBAA_11960 [Vreelandella sulfidaeris]|uniref:Uncharacterized protein n=1 Tax=Vreelandella sulfidaeris TaxID=115553 RepID=A0A455U1M0_9GAMM|nr:hypothetical protein HSBAA_11960 [Halomonas sulfidaeris]
MQKVATSCWKTARTVSPPPDDRDTLWFGAWGQSEAEKYHARLTWNPYFLELLAHIRAVTDG